MFSHRQNFFTSPRKIPLQPKPKWKFYVSDDRAKSLTSCSAFRLWLWRSWITHLKDNQSCAWLQATPRRFLTKARWVLWISQKWRLSQPISCHSLLVQLDWLTRAIYYSSFNLIHKHRRRKPNKKIWNTRIDLQLVLVLRVKDLRKNYEHFMNEIDKILFFASLVDIARLECIFREKMFSLEV